MDMLLEKSERNHFGRHLTDIHIRVDHVRLPRMGHDNFDQNNPQHPHPPTLEQFAQMTRRFPNIRFSISFEREMRYARHAQIMGGEHALASFRLHRLELRGDAFSDTSANEPSLSATMVKILPRYGDYLNKLVLDWYSPVEYLNTELFALLKSCQHLAVLKMKLFIEFDVVCKLLNLIRFCNDDLEQEEISEFSDFPECIPNDMTTLPRKLKKLTITRYCFEDHDDDMVDDDPDWAEWNEHNHLENEYKIAIERLRERGDFEYTRTVAY